MQISPARDQPSAASTIRRNARTASIPAVVTNGSSHVVELVNDALLDVTSSHAEDLEGAPLTLLVDGEGAAALERVYQTGTPMCCSCAWRASREDELRFTCVVCPICEIGQRPSGLVVYVVDQSGKDRQANMLRQTNEALILASLREKELAERATRLYEAAAKATRAREELLAIVSHDLRNPLGAIFMSLDALERTATPEDLGKQLPRLRRAAEGMNRLILDLLDAASIEAGRFAIERRLVPIEPVVEGAVEAVEPLVSGKPVKLTCTIPPGLPAIDADPTRVQQVLLNLLSNAIKFTSSGEIHVRVGCGPGEGTLECSVQDSGSGIDGDALPHVFDRYWRANNRAHAGTGLGLYIARGIVEAHGGRLWAESKPGAGSTFSFTLPLRASKR